MLKYMLLFSFLFSNIDYSTLINELKNNEKYSGFKADKSSFLIEKIELALIDLKNNKVLIDNKVIVNDHLIAFDEMIKNSNSKFNLSILYRLSKVDFKNSEVNEYFLKRYNELELELNSITAKLEIVGTDRLTMFAQLAIKCLTTGTYSEMLDKYSFEITTSNQKDEFKALIKYVENYGGVLNKEKLYDRIDNMINEYEKTSAASTNSKKSSDNSSSKLKGADGMRSLLEKM